MRFTFNVFKVPAEIGLELLLAFRWLRQTFYHFMHSTMRCIAASSGSMRRENELRVVNVGCGKKRCGMNERLKGREKMKKIKEEKGTESWWDNDGSKEYPTGTLQNVLLGLIACKAFLQIRSTDLAVWNKSDCSPWLIAPTSLGITTKNLSTSSSFGASALLAYWRHCLKCPI